MTRIVNIRGVLHSVRPDRLVIHSRTYTHVMLPEGFDNERYHERVGKGISVWAVQGADGLVLKVADKATGMVAPVENNYVRRR